MPANPASSCFAKRQCAVVLVQVLETRVQSGEVGPREFEAMGRYHSSGASVDVHARQYTLLWQTAAYSGVPNLLPPESVFSRKHLMPPSLLLANIRQIHSYQDPRGPKWTQARIQAHML